mmetsp:Transcript_34605/g.112552  ORF Transcript_34605/g.112552 Transcript_34605/m.112552 type:complete len:212 (+) Transcript_34605:259-894(+)
MQMYMSMMLYDCSSYVVTKFVAYLGLDKVDKHRRREPCPSQEHRASWMALRRVCDETALPCGVRGTTLEIIFDIMQLAPRVFSECATYPLLPFLAVEHWLPLEAWQAVDQRSRRTEHMNSESWMEGYLSERLKIATLGRRRARSGKSRYLEEMLMFFESCRSGGAPGSGRRGEGLRGVRRQMRRHGRVCDAAGDEHPTAGGAERAQEEGSQ